MDNKRLIIVTVLCFLLMLGWQQFAQYMGWVTLRPATTASAPVDQATPKTAAAATSAASVLPSFAPTEGREVKVETPLYSATFHSAGGVLQSFILKRFSTSVAPNAPLLNMVSKEAAAASPMGLLLNGQPTWNVGHWAFDGDNVNLAAGQSGKLVFSGEANGVRITRTITFHADTYLMDEETTLAAESAPSLARLSPTLAASSFSEGNSRDAMSLVWSLGDSFSHESSQKTMKSEGVMKTGEAYWAGLATNYFLAAVVPAKTPQAVIKGRATENDVWRVAVETPDISLAPGAPVTIKTNWWMGPKDQNLLKAAPNNLASCVDLGWFYFLAQPMLWLLSFLHSLVGNWGVAIILLTVCIKLALWPLSRKSYQSMDKMKKIQPMVAQLQQKYAKDKEALSRETMQLYKTYGVNPMGGCLPLLVQMPIFVALYNALLHSMELRHAVFIPHLPFTNYVWLADLSAQDPFYITPLVMGATMFLQQWMSPAAGDPTQQKVMMLMPVIFTVTFIAMPSGLVLYWLCNNLLSIAQQWWVMRKRPEPTAK